VSELTFRRTADRKARWVPTYIAPGQTGEQAEAAMRAEYERSLGRTIVSTCSRGGL
jgi:hypothetical protein